MKKPLDWSWIAGSPDHAPGALIRAAEQLFDGDWSYRSAVSQLKGFIGPVVHVASLGKVSLVCWTGSGAPSCILTVPLSPEATQRRLESGLVLAPSPAFRGSHKSKNNKPVGRVGCGKPAALTAPRPLLAGPSGSN